MMIKMTTNGDCENICTLVQKKLCISISIVKNKRAPSVSLTRQLVLHPERISTAGNKTSLLYKV